MLQINLGVVQDFTFPQNRFGDYISFGMCHSISKFYQYKDIFQITVKVTFIIKLYTCSVFYYVNNKENIKDSMRSKLLFCQDVYPHMSHNLMVNTVPHISLQ